MKMEVGYRMIKRKSPLETKNMRQTSLWLPHSTYDGITQAAGARGLAGEIRRRLEISLKADQGRDEKTAELMDAITRVRVNIPVGKNWHGDRLAFEVFKAAINHLLSEYQPSSEVLPESMDKLQAKYGKDANAETVGRILASAALMSSRDKQEE
jgi:hypothetical protein